MTVRTDWLSELLEELKRGLAQLYGDRLRGVYLYGSYARGEEESESDVDVVVVLTDFDSYASEVDRTGSLVSTLSLDYGVSISRVFVSEHTWQQTQSPFLTNVREEALSV